MGVGNGLILVSKTTVSEMAKGDQKWEQKSMGLVMGMFGWGFLVAPVISGSLSDPVKQYPSSVFQTSAFYKSLFITQHSRMCIMCNRCSWCFLLCRRNFTRRTKKKY